MAWWWPVAAACACAVLFYSATQLAAHARAPAALRHACTVREVLTSARTGTCTWAADSAAAARHAPLLGRIIAEELKCISSARCDAGDLRSSAAGATFDYAGMGVRFQADYARDLGNGAPDVEALLDLVVQCTDALAAVEILSCVNAA